MLSGILKLNDVKWCVAIGVLMLTAYSLSPDWQEWLMDSTLGLWLSRLKQIIETHLLLNVLLASLTVGATYVICRRWYQDTDNRWYRPQVVIMWLQLLWIENPLETVGIIGWFDYRWLCTLCLVVLLSVFVINHEVSAKLINNCKGEAKIQDARFTVDHIDPSKLSDSMKKYGDSIVNHLLGTRLDKESFAIGVTGAWGSGKTTFMKYLEGQLKDKAEVVWFNPWMCRTPEQVTEDFFVALHNQLSPKHSRLSRPIRDYANYMSAVTSSLGIGSLSKLVLAMPQMSLNDRKKHLSELFEKLDKPVVVFIDDLDRLECDEVFEVLRLIRNTADLSNVFYVVTFDKAYVTDAMKEKGISDATVYQEKIFPIEVPLPAIEDTQLYDILYLELSRHHKYKEKVPNHLFGKIDKSDREIVLTILHSYRSILRFARLFLLNLDYLQVTYSQEMKLLDLFWLELLQVYDKKTYDILYGQRELLLITTGKIYSLRPGVINSYVSENEIQYAYKGETFWHTLTPKILEHLFRDRQNVSQVSMRYAENYDKYFTLSVSENRLSFRDYKRLFNTDTPPLELVAEWVNGQKYFGSIMFHFEQTAVNRLSQNNLKRYIVGLLELSYMTGEQSEQMIQNIKDRLRISNYMDGQASWGKGCVLGWFKNKIGQEGNLKSISKILNRFNISEEINEYGNKTMAVSLLISNEDVKALLCDVMTQYLKINPTVSALDILSTDKELGKIFGYCSVCVSYNTSNGDEQEYENVVFDIVIQHFEQKEKPSSKEFDKAMDKLFREEPPEGLEPWEYSDFYNTIEDRRSVQLNEHFGSNWSKVEDFKKRCFAENVNQYI